MRRGLTIPWVVVVCALTILALLFALFSARQRAYAAGMRADSLEVAHDTLLIRHAADLLLWERRVLQGRIAQSRLERELARRPAVVVRPVLQVDTLRLTDTVLVEGDTIRTAAFLRYQPPVKLSALVVVPPTPGLATLDATMTLDTIPLGLRILCGRSRNGVRPVTAQVETPPWVTVRMDTPQAVPEVCNHPAPRRGIPWWTLPLAFGAGALLR